MLKFARLGRDLVVVFGGSEFFAPLRLRLFHTGGNRFSAVAYRVAPNPDESTRWTPDAFGKADRLDAAEHIPSLRVVGDGCPTTVEVGDADLAMLVAKAKPPCQRLLPWLRSLPPADTRAAADLGPGERSAGDADPMTQSGETPDPTTLPPTARNG